MLGICFRVNFVMSEDTTLADLLDLNLHNFEDEVHNIVDKAIKEMAMERMLKELEVIWSAMDFQHEVVSGPILFSAMGRRRSGVAASPPHRVVRPLRWNPDHQTEVKKSFFLECRCQKIENSVPCISK
jgi:hypothetical protein